MADTRSMLLGYVPTRTLVTCHTVYILYFHLYTFQLYTNQIKLDKSGVV